MKRSYHIFLCGTILSVVQSASQAADNPAETRTARSFVYAQAVDRDGNVFFATGTEGVFVHDRNGIRDINNGLTTRSVYSLECDHRGTLYAGSDNGVYSSTNDGNSWSPLQGLENTTVIALAISREGTVFAVTHEKAFFRREQNGTKWERVALHDLGIVTVEVEHRGGILACSRDGILYRSNDDGASWERVSDSGVGEEVACMMLDRDEGILVGTRGGGVFASSGDEWKHLGEGLRSAVVHSLRIVGVLLYAGTDDGVYVLSKRNGRWTKLSGMLTKIPVLSLAVFGEHNVFAGTSGFGLIRVQ